MNLNLSFFKSPVANELALEIAQKLNSENQLSLIEGYRKAGFENELVAFALTQARYKQRARVKFGDQAMKLLFTEQGLEQATRAAVATWHANRFKSWGISSVTDLGAGIGSDSLGFLESGLEVVAVESHPESYLALEHNLSNYQLAKTVQADATSHHISTAAIWLDPARREQDRKSLTVQRLEPEMFSPNLDFVFEQARKYPAGIKLAPGFPHELIPSDFEANWVSHNQDLVELTLWSTPLGRPGVRKAVLISDQVLEFEGTDSSGWIGPLKNFVYEPDVSLIRSHLIGEFAKQNQLSLISENIAYLSSDTFLESPWLKAYEVIEVIPLDVKQIKSYCSKHDIGVLEIKKRGVDITPEQLRPKLKLRGAGAATLILTKVGSARQAIVSRPIR